MIIQHAKVLTLITLSITSTLCAKSTEEHVTSLKSRQMQEITTRIPSLNQSNYRSNISWGADNGWDIWEIHFMEFPTNLINEIYSEEEYSRLSCNNSPSPYNYMTYFPNGWYSQFQGKTVTSQYIESPKYVNGELDSYQYMSDDIVKFTNNSAISSLNESINGTTQADSIEGRMQFNVNGQPLTLNLDANYLMDFTSISYQYEGNNIKLCSGIYEESESSIHKIEYRMDYTDDGAISSMCMFTGVGSSSASIPLAIEDSTVYNFRNGVLNDAITFTFDQQGNSTRSSKISYEYYPSELLKTKVTKKWNSLNEWSITSSSDSTKYTYNSSDCITLIETFSGQATGHFIAESKDSTLYNERNKAVEEHSFIWSTTANQWEPKPYIATSFYAYDNSGNLISYQWNDEDPYQITYENGYPSKVIQTINDSIVAIKNISVEDYSSPISENSAKHANDSYIVTDFSLELNCKESSNVSNLKLFNLSGQVVAVVDSEQNGTNVSYNIGESQIAAGIYVARFNIDGSPLSTKIQIQ